MPDQRFDYLCELFKPPSKIPAFLHVTDIAGLIKGASEGTSVSSSSARRPAGWANVYVYVVVVRGSVLTPIVYT